MKSRLFILAAAALALTACDSDNPVPPTEQGPLQPLANPPQSLVVQIIHAVPDAPPVNVTVGSTTVNGIDFKGTFGGIGIEPATLSVSVDAVDADATIPGIIPATDVTFAADTIVTIVAVGSTATIQPIIAVQPLTGVTAGTARLFVLHGAEGAGSVDVYVSAAGVAPVPADLLGTFDFLGEIGPAEVAAGSYLITVTEAGNIGNVVFDGTVTVGDGMDAVLVATPTTAGGSTAAISLVGHARNMNAAVEFVDDDDPAFVRVVHLSPDAPAVDVHLDANPMPAFAGLTFPNATAITEIEPATYEVEVSPAGGYPGTVVIPAAGDDPIELDLAAGTTTNVLAVDVLASIGALVAAEDPRPVSTYAKVRLIHASPTAGDVDVYVTDPGVTDLSGETPVATDVSFLDNSGFAALDDVNAAGMADYDITVTAAGSMTAAIGPIPLEIADGDVVTIIARDEVGGGAVSADVVVLMD